MKVFLFGCLNGQQNGPLNVPDEPPCIHMRPNGKDIIGVMQCNGNGLNSCRLPGENKNESCSDLQLHSQTLVTQADSFH